MPFAAASAGGRAARDVLPPEQGARRGHRRGGAGHAPTTTTEMKLEIVHSTRYRYTGPLAETAMEVRLQPMDGSAQRGLDFNLELSHRVKPQRYVAGYGNHVHYLKPARPPSASSALSR